MSDVERIFDRFIDAFADDLLEIARAHIDVEVARALSVAERSNSKHDKAAQRVQKREARLAAKSALKAKKQQAREEKRTQRLADKEQLKADKVAERQVRQVEHDRLKQQRLALKHELEAERRRLREATRKRPARQLPLDFDGLRTPTRRRADPVGPPALFVHKRKRDGQIEALARKDEPAPKSSASNGAVSNGVPASPPAE